MPKTFSSPGGFYTIDYPDDWSLSVNSNTVNIAPPDQSGAVTVSAFGGDRVDESLLRRLIGKVLGKHRIVVPLEPTMLNNWHGVRGEYFDDQNRRVFVVVGAARNKVMVLVTANDELGAMEARRKSYEDIVASLKLGELQ